MAFMIAAVGNDIEKVWRWELIENDYMGGVENVEMEWSAILYPCVLSPSRVEAPLTECFRDKSKQRPGSTGYSELVTLPCAQGTRTNTAWMMQGAECFAKF